MSCDQQRGKREQWALKQDPGESTNEDSQNHARALKCLEKDIDICLLVYLVYLSGIPRLHGSFIIFVILLIESVSKAMDTREYVPRNW